MLAAHNEQTVDPADAKVPMGHNEQESSRIPADTFENFPGGHFMQTELPVVFANVPALHSKQAVPMVFEYFPIPQSVQELDEDDPETTEYFPAEQSTQPADPV